MATPQIKQLRAQAEKLREQLAQLEAVPGVLTEQDKERRRKRAEKQERDAIREQLPELLTTLPKSLYAELSGRQIKILLDQGARYGLPLLEKKVNLYQLLRRFHDLLAEHGDKLLKQSDEIDDDQTNSPALEKLRTEKWRIARLERRELQGQLLRRELVHSALLRIAGGLRQTGEKLQRAGNHDGFDAITELISTLEREVDQFLGNYGSTDEPTTEPHAAGDPVGQDDPA